MIDKRIYIIIVIAFLFAGAGALIAQPPINLPLPNKNKHRTQQQRQKRQEQVIDGLVRNMVYVEGGTFMMGNNNGSSYEKPAHEVTLYSFSIGRYEVTQEEWEAIMGSNPSHFKGAKLPVEYVSWEDCQEFIGKLNAKTGMTFRLPTEAEWEFAARGGNKSRGYRYSGSDNIDDVAWYMKTVNSYPHHVGLKHANELGLYDMSGNVSEWCQDSRRVYSNEPQMNPVGLSSDTSLLIRGGSWLDKANYCRTTNRFLRSVHGYSSYTIGFRIVLEQPHDDLEEQESKIKKQQQEEKQQEDEQRRQQQEMIISGIIDNMVHVEGGIFQMGNDDFSKHIHNVTLSSFSIGRYEVTQEEWETIMGSNPSRFKGPKLPVESVSWEDCQEFIAKLNAKTGMIFRLPTEAEWEFAARGGNKSSGFKYAGGDILDKVAWYRDNSDNTTHEVGMKVSNELGLYDMSGNVFEWCQDWWGGYPSWGVKNPVGPESGEHRIRRGGSWDWESRHCQTDQRNCCDPSYRLSQFGLRLAQ